MKLYGKIFLSSITVLILALCGVEYVMVSGSFKRAMESEIDHETEQYRFIRLAFYLGGTDSGMEQLGDRYGVLYSEDGEVLVSTFPEELRPESGETDPEVLTCRMVSEGEEKLLLVSGLVSVQGESCRLITGKQVNVLYEDKAMMEQEYRRAIYLAVAVCAFVQAVLAYVIAKPLRRLQVQADRIADGCYGERVRAQGQDEIAELSRSFNRMAEAVEQKVEELSLEAERKEQFMGDFSHEIKTPMTAIIGYADRLYQKDCSRDEVREAAGYILNEGMRLEALSGKMLRLIALGQESFFREQIPAGEFFEDLKETTEPLLAGKAALTVSWENGIMNMEWDLMKTLVMNLMDNAGKSGASRVEVLGTVRESGYEIAVRDNGRGIPAEKLPHIQEAFYMVDKSRSRKQNGAGLGLALCRKIAALHDTSLVIVSREGSGTEVSLVLPGKENGSEPNEIGKKIEKPEENEE